MVRASQPTCDVSLACSRAVACSNDNIGPEDAGYTYHAREQQGLRLGIHVMWFKRPILMEGESNKYCTHMPCPNLYAIVRAAMVSLSEGRSES